MENKTVTETTGRKRKKKEKKKRSVGKIILRVFLVLLAICLVGAGVAFIKVKKIIDATPEINPSNVYDLLQQNSVILDTEGNTIQNVFSGGSLRTNIDISEMPQQLKQAFVSIEDKTFYDHHGFNYIRIIGAIWDKISGKSERIGGTSTITQQLARNLYLSDIKSERSLERKIQEAYYTVVIERSLTKDQILEAYLNTIYLGFNSNGVQAAAQAYFSKNAWELDLIECAELASLPQSPNNYAPVKRIESDKVTEDSDYDIIERGPEWTLVFNDSGKDRRNLVLYFMHDQEKISDEEYQAAKEESLRDHINPGRNVMTTAESSYFSDYVVSQVIADMQTKLDYSYDDAYKLVYGGGLIIQSTMNPKVQTILDEEYAKQSNFPGVGNLLKDKNGNILYNSVNLSTWQAAQKVADAKDILIYSKEKYFNADGDFVLSDSEFDWKGDGSLIVYKGNRINIYKTSSGGNVDYSVEFKGLYEIENDRFYYYNGGYWAIPASYKDRDAEGNLVLSAQYFLDKPEAFTKNEDGTLTLHSDFFVVRDRVIEPQSAMVIMDYSTGHIAGMIGGREIEGSKLYNRALSPRQPGSSMKPLAVYSTALQAGYDGIGPFTAAYPIDDIPIYYNGQIWPKNWYSGYRGATYLRNAVEQSINACSVRLFSQLDPQLCIDHLVNMGITSLVTTGTVNDVNASALALGGMTKGVSPLEMTAAYATFGNYGTYISPACYTTVTNRRGDIVLEKEQITRKVMDEPVASLMTDILRTTVTRGLASGAKLSTQPSAGKTGTTSEKYDVWFCGLTPKYAAAVWIGNDVNIQLKKDSSAATALWKAVMERVGGLDEKGEFVMKGEFVTKTVDKYSGKLADQETSMGGSAITEIFIKGTEPTEFDDAHKITKVCSYSGYLATPLCETYGFSTFKLTVTRSLGCSLEKYIIDSGMVSKRASGTVYLLSPSSVGDSVNDTPDYYCPFHNPDMSKYPVSPYFMNTRSGELEEYTLPTPGGGSSEGGSVEYHGGDQNPDTRVEDGIRYDIPPEG